jgi:hypothetical protein
VALALSALDCVLLSRQGIYASSELTSGQRAQRLQREHDLSDSGALRDHLGPQRYHTLLWSPNVEAALAFAEKLRPLVGIAELVISPAPFVAPDWPQQAYLAFWEKVIRSRVKAVYFNEGWEYSNGCVFELSVAAVAGLPTFDSTTRRLSTHQAIDKITRALTELKAYGFATQSMESSLDRLTRQVGR